eukprot:6213141-Pleurochrysis_carterae.AAC.1
MESAGKLRPGERRARRERFCSDVHTERRRRELARIGAQEHTRTRTHPREDACAHRTLRTRPLHSLWRCAHACDALALPPVLPLQAHPPRGSQARRRLQPPVRCTRPAAVIPPPAFRAHSLLHASPFFRRSSPLSPALFRRSHRSRRTRVLARSAGTSG